MRTISLLILLVVCLTVGINVYALFFPEEDDYVFWCNIVTGAALLAMMVLVALRKKQVQKYSSPSSTAFLAGING